MIGIDTNVLVRIFVRDHEAQTAAALKFLTERSSVSPGFVSAVVITELAWVLDRSYGYGDDAIFEAIDWLFDSANIVVEREELMERAITLARAARADVSDTIIATLAAEAGAAKTLTFDKTAAQRVPGMELLT